MVSAVLVTLISGPLVYLDFFPLIRVTPTFFTILCFCAGALAIYGFSRSSEESFSVWREYYGLFDLVTKVFIAPIGGLGLLACYKIYLSKADFDSGLLLVIILMTMATALSGAYTAWYLGSLFSRDD